MRNLLAAALLAATCISGTAAAQTAPIEGRVDKLEKEMRAVQRKVFPGGAGQTVEPQITPETTPAVIPGTPASTPLADLTQRVASLESQVQSLTAQAEQNGHHLRQLQDAFDAYKSATDARLKTLEGAGTPPPSVAPGADVSGNTAAAASSSPFVTVKPMPADTATKPGSGARADQVAGIERPNTGDPAEDGYTYGFRLWQAKLYPEARKALEEVATKYPQHRRASYAQNLLGRAYLDAGAPSLAAVAFYENYKKNPNGERAGDSLYYLAQALTKLKKPPSEICKVYAELTQLYSERLNAEMRAGVAEGRAVNKCQ